MDQNSISQHDWYATVCKNVISFLQLYSSLQIFYKPRILFEDHSLERIKSIRASTPYPATTRKFVSYLDLLVGVLRVPEFLSNETLKKSLENLLGKVFPKLENFKLLEIKQGEEYLEKSKVLSFKSCDILTEISACFHVLKKLPAFNLHLPHGVTNQAGEMVMKLSSILENVLVSLKTKKAANTYYSFQKQDLTKIEDGNFAVFEETLKSWSSTIWSELSKVNWDQKGVVLSEKEIMVIQECNTFVEKLSSRILKEEQFENFIMFILEIANICSTYVFANDTRMERMLNILIHFFFFLACQSQFNKILGTSSEEVDGLPSLSKVISKDLRDNLEKLPELSSTFSHFRRSREFDSEMLLADLCQKHTEYFKKHFYTEKTEMTDLILMITRNFTRAIEFTIKREMLMSIVRQENENLGIKDERYYVDVVRTRVIDSTLEAFTNTTTRNLKRQTEIHYHEEEGFDGGGLTREWLTLLSKELFDPEAGLFRLSENKQSIQPSPLAHLIPHQLRLFELAGIIIAKAIRDQNTIDVTFTKSFLKHIKNQKIVFSDLEDIDLSLSKNLHWILENSVEGLELTFTYETEILGQKITRELIPDGHDTAVTDENKKEYVKMVCESKMRDEIKDEISAFLHGFHRVMNPLAMELFNPSEIQLLIAGVPEIKIEEFRMLTDFEGFQDTNIEEWFWEILEEFSQKDLAAFLYFFSGSLKLAYASTTRYRFVTAYNDSSLPVAHTCYTEIELPQYGSKDEFKTKLLYAIYEGHQGFYMS